MHRRFALTLAPALGAIALLCIPASVPAAQGTVAVRLLDHPLAEPRAHAATYRSVQRSAPTQRLTERTSSTTDSLLVPYFQVDRRSKRGVTTLFAVRNETGRELPVRILYLNSLEAIAQVTREVTLAPHAVHTVNLRDVGGLEADPDGMARGLVLLGVIGGWKNDTDFLSGDFIVLDPATGFSTGNTLVNVSVSDPENEFCTGWGSRFFNGGRPQAASDLTFTVDRPGGEAELDPPTVVGTVYDEAGTPVQSFEIRTDLHTFRLPAEDLAPASLPSGSLSISFVDTEGILLMEHAARDRVALGMKAVCRDRVPPE